MDAVIEIFGRMHCVVAVIVAGVITGILGFDVSIVKQKLMLTV